VRVGAADTVWRKIALLLACLLPACGAPAPPEPVPCPGAAADLAPELAAVRVPPVPGSAEVSPAALRAWIELLAAPEMKGRHATSPQAQVVAALLAERLAALGLEAPFADGGYCQVFPLMGGHSRNVVAHLRAAAAGAGRAAVLVGAHYDGQGLHPAGFVYPSADDNASGVAALLEVARLAARRRAWPFDLVFVAFGAEEVGRIGARAWLREPSLPATRLRLMINFDMVGRPWPGAPAEAIGYRATGDPAAGDPAAGDPAAGTGPAAALREAAAAAGVTVRALSERFSEDDLVSDSSVFAAQVPTLYLSTGLHADYHQRTDTPGRVDVGQTARAVELTLSLLDALAREPDR